ncbi:isotrichodermin C-15 hydroxylase [Nannizzia gypsea CBS 118893]|uniref:Isotrichodermin C-15 hydroxylase n=1 Tax=Arthroderma gypseum (strain ATCC MYA-4604 / CBS 118893) TaxID=535722 RepID=E4UXN5_ARTGP|nr:isotrichodermin C-15 hydroxylase [Nannizzia gypsea CBS 118893]EFR01930.1 isotrichodermin C-15 hydroxylase [Nannizzia gypsea CBS 118893]
MEKILLIPWLWPTNPNSQTEYHLSLWVILTALVALLYLSPVAKYPGPLLAKFTSLPIVYHAWKGDIHLDLWMCHLKYGPVVRYSPSFVSFNTSISLHEIYGMGSNAWKHHQFEALSPRAQNLVTLHDKKTHAKRRRLIGRSFTDTYIKTFENRMLYHINSFCESIDLLPLQQHTGGWKREIKMSDWCSYLTFDINMDFIFGSDYSLLKSSKYRYILNDIEDASTRNAVLIYMPHLAVGGLHRKIFPRAVKGTRSFWRFIKSAISDHSEPMKRKCVVSNILQLTNASSESPLSTDTMQSESGGLAIAGLDTTATAMASVFFYLSRNQHAYEKLASEIRSSFSSADEIQLGPTLHQCKYLDACINECLRITPPIGSCLWREVGKGGITVDNNFIPEGFSVGTSIYSIHHNEGYFSRPHEFIPERWMVDEQDTQKAAQVAIAKAAFAPFSIGPRGCIGRPLVNSTLKLAIAMLIWKYDFRLADGVAGGKGAGHPLGGRGRTNPMEFQVLDRIMSIVDGPMIQFRHRT